MKREEAVNIGVSMYAQTAAWFLLTAYCAYMARGAAVASDGGDAYAGLVVLAAFALSTLLVLMLAKMQAFMRIYAVLVYFALLYGVYFILALMWPFQAAVVMLPLAACVLFFSPRVIAQNAVLALALAGIATQFGALISFTTTLVLLSVLAVYDIVAVNVTHHMVAMAKTVIKQHLPVVFILPRKPSELALHAASFEPGEQAVFLGAGDIALPAILVVTAPTAHLAVMVMVGTLLGFALLTVTFLTGARKHPLPALPFLLTGIFLALGLNML